MDFKSKYFKYKNKYLNLKKSKKSGGANINRDKCVKGECIDGYGESVSSKGSSYKVTFKNGCKEKGFYTWTTGETYDGEWNCAGSKHGKGIYKFKSGIVYEGEFFNDVMTKGKMTYPSGNVYEGELLEGKRHGTGKYTLTDGTVYEGTFVHNEFRFNLLEIKKNEILNLIIILILYE